MTWNRLTIRTRLTLVIAAILVAGFMTTNIISLRISSSTIKSTILNNELPLTSSNIYSEIQSDLLRPILVSSLMANDTFLASWLADGEQDVAAVTRYLSRIKTEYGVFTAFLISNRTLAYYHTSGLSRHVDQTKPDDQWFFRARDLKQRYEINVDTNKEQQDAITIFINYRVLDHDGNFVGLTGVGLNLESVARVISRYKTDFQRNVYFVDKTGAVVVRSNSGVGISDNIRTSEGISKIADRVLGATDGYFEYERNGETMFLTTRFIPELGWHLMVEQGERDALKNIWAGFLMNNIIGLAIIALTVLVVAYAINIYQRRLEDLVVTDKLTGVGNRARFEKDLERAFSIVARRGGTFSLVLFDIDHFKDVNDRYGHLKGDDVIRRVVDATSASVRSDTSVCRWGGEEIILLLQDCPLRKGVEIGERVRSRIATTPLTDPDSGARVTISAGVAEFTAGDTPDSILNRADQALYRAKRAGRDRVVAALPEAERSGAA